MLPKILLNFYLNLIFIFNFFLASGLDVDNGFLLKFQYFLIKINLKLM